MKTYIVLFKHELSSIKCRVLLHVEKYFTLSVSSITYYIIQAVTYYISHGREFFLVACRNNLHIFLKCQPIYKLSNVKLINIII